jgi:hypothetical protein
VRGSLVAAVVVSGLAVCQPIAQARASCLGRPQLTCTLRAALYNDSVNSAIGGFAAVDLFEAPGPLHLSNPALAQFWHFEAATGITRYVYELAVGSQGNDLAFETIPQAMRLPAPRIKPSGIVNRRSATALSRLLSAEQQEIVNLLAMDIALNRATGATISSRSDWATYQTYVAARFAREAAGAMNALVSRQRSVTAALLRAGLRFGVGEADQHAAQRHVRAHGWPRAIKQNLLTLGMSAAAVRLAKSAFLNGNVGATTFSLSRQLSSTSVVKDERKCARALLQFADRTPTVPVPS